MPVELYTVKEVPDILPLSRHRVAPIPPVFAKWRATGDNVIRLIAKLVKASRKA
jgi:hypothetical protein